MTEATVAWVPLKEVCEAYGFTFRSALNAVREGRFPIQTYKLGKRVVVDKTVHSEFFARQRQKGLAALKST